MNDSGDDVSWIGAQPVTRKKRPTASVTSKPFPSVSRSVDTTTRVADVKKPVVLTKSSPPKNDPTLCNSFIVLFFQINIIIYLPR